MLDKKSLADLDEVTRTTVYPLYTDTRYNDKIHYNDNLVVTTPSLKR